MKEIVLEGDFKLFKEVWIKVLEVNEEVRKMVNECLVDEWELFSFNFYFLKVFFFLFDYFEYEICYKCVVIELLIFYVIIWFKMLLNVVII